jgi:AraC-like DNA-binding protein
MAAFHPCEAGRNAGYTVMDRDLRTWWRWFDDLPRTLGRVHAWRVPQAGAPRGAGHLHPNPTSMICLAGVVRVRYCGGQALDLQPGDALLVGPGVWHHQEPLRADAVVFGQGFMMDCSDIGFGSPGRYWSGRLPMQPCHALMQSALAASIEPQRQERLRELLRQVAAEPVDAVDLHQAGLHPMVRLLWSRFHTGLTVAELLRASGLSRSRAYAVFTTGYGASPKAALETMRLWLAKGHLDAGVPVTETARRCGFANAGTFTRAWRRTHGRPPREHQ